MLYSPKCAFNMNSLVFISMMFCTEPSFCAPPRKNDEKLQLQAPSKLIKKQPNLAKRPEHLEAVPLERDGGLNAEFRQEILLGKDANGLNENAKDMDGKKTVDLLNEMFKLADKNSDGKLNADELESKIIDNTLRHLDESQIEAKETFNVIDQNGDKLISWSEYHYHFLVGNKITSAETAKNHQENIHESLDEDTKFQMEDDREAFKKADAGNNGLDEIEWLSFRHPEHSSVMLKDMANGIMKALDADKDGQLSEDEFSAPEIGDVDAGMEDSEQEFIEDRRKEFKTTIDTDKNGFVNAEELLEYVNPRNPLHAKQEVTEIMSIADFDLDSFLSLDELIAQKDLLERSGFIRAKARLHDDL